MNQFRKENYRDDTEQQLFLCAKRENSFGKVKIPKEIVFCFVI